MAFLLCGCLLLVSLHLFEVVRAGEADWGTAPDPCVYTCLGQTVNLTWALAGSRSAEDIDSIRWFHRAASGPELVAATSYGQFFPGQTYAGRVSQLQRSGISLNDVQSRDEGNYSIEIIVRQGNQQLVSFTHSVALKVGDGLMTKDGRLNVKQDSAAFWNATSKSWMIRLLCGQFFFQGRAPVDVEWILPTGEIKINSTYEGGKFYLSLDPASVVDGNYTCRIPPNYYSVVCLDKQTEGNASSITSATIVVDEVRIRLTLAEAEQKRLNEENKELQTALVNLTAEMQNKIQDLMTATEELSRKNIPGCGRDAYDLLDDPERDVNYITPSEPWACTGATGVRSWYRMFLGGHDAVIPTTCIPTLHCGTLASGWLNLQNKSLPGLGEDLDTRVCFHMTNDCCSRDAAVSVRNCGSFFLYRLEIFEKDCYYNYCLQKKI